MSAATPAPLLPSPGRDDAPRRHLDIAPTRAQRRARPRVYAALIAIGGIAAILLSQLLLSIVLADGAYQISALQREKRDLVREQHAAQENLQQLSSTQSLLQNAKALGMVPSGNPVFLDVSRRKTMGASGPATGQLVGLGRNYILNTLLADGSTKLDPSVIKAAKSGETGVQAEDVGALPGVAPVVTTPGTIPSPTTH